MLQATTAGVGPSDTYAGLPSDEGEHEVGAGRIGLSAEAAPRGVRVFHFRLSLDKRYPRLRAFVHRLRSPRA